MGRRKKNKVADVLHFPCECVSALGGYSDPWAAIAQKKLLNDGTKERILNSVARQPETIARLATELGLSQPAVHTHINDMLLSELLREAKEWKKKHPAENYYEVNFPVIKGADREAFDPICNEIAEQVAEIFESRQVKLKAAMEQTRLPGSSWEFSDLAQYLYCCVQRGARNLLEERGVLPRRKKHRNGSEWLFWAEESNSA